jgi:hypothetical protein
MTVLIEQVKRFQRSTVIYNEEDKGEEFFILGSSSSSLSLSLSLSSSHTLINIMNEQLWSLDAYVD